MSSLNNSQSNFTTRPDDSFRLPTMEAFFKVESCQEFASLPWAWRAAKSASPLPMGGKRPKAALPTVTMF